MLFPASYRQVWRSCRGEKLKADFSLLWNSCVLRREIHCQKSNSSMGPLASEHPRTSPGAGNCECSTSGLSHLPQKSNHLFSNSLACLPLGRPTLASFSFRGRDHVISKHTTSWQRTWEWAPGSPGQGASSDFVKITSPSSLVCEVSSSSNGFSCQLVNLNEKNISSLIWCVCMYMRVCMCMTRKNRGNDAHSE